MGMTAVGEETMGLMMTEEEKRKKENESDHDGGGLETWPEASVVVARIFSKTKQPTGITLPNLQ